MAARSARKAGEGSTRLYELLELEPGASAAEIKRAYRRLAVQHHPDKGGDPEHFKEVALAYEVLGDERRRQEYDERGEASIQGAVDPADLFEMFFGQGSRGRVRKKTKDVVHALSLSLEQLYTGCSKKLAINRVVVDEAAGTRRCEDCNGTGVKAHNPPHLGLLLPGGGACQACTGSGQRHKTRKQREVLEVFIDKGAPHGHRVVFAGKADEQPGHDPGDVVFIVHQQDHPDFKRRGADLFLRREIGLLDALTGFQMPITHLDGRRVVVTTRPGEVVQPLSEGTGLKAVMNEGMPTLRNPFVFGALFLILEIQFPDVLDPAHFPKLSAALGASEAGICAASGSSLATAETVKGEDEGEVWYLEDMDPLESEQLAAGLGPAVRQVQQEPQSGGGSGAGPGCPLQ